jgi:hypothetical protein
MFQINHKTTQQILGYKTIFVLSIIGTNPQKIHLLISLILKEWKSSLQWAEIFKIKYWHEISFICTYMRPNSLCDYFNLFVNQSIYPDEIIV